MARQSKNPPANAGDASSTLGWEDHLEKETAIHSSILAWKIAWTEDPGGLQSMGCKESYTTEMTEHTRVFSSPES